MRAALSPSPLPGFEHSRVQGLQHRFRVAFGDAEEGAGGAFRAAMALLPVLQGARADADERGRLTLTEAEFFANNAGVGPVERGFAGGFLFSAQDGAAFFEAGDELLEEFVFHGNSDWIRDGEKRDLRGHNSRDAATAGIRGSPYR